MVYSGSKLVEAKLIFSGSDKEWKIYSFDYGFTQYTDDTGKVTGNPTGGTINLSVESSSDTTLINWMLDPKAKKSGKIEVGNKDKVIEFKDAVCIQFHESFNYQGGSSPMTISFTISAVEITIDGQKFEQKRKTQ